MESNVACPRTQHNAPSQGLNPDCLIEWHEATAPVGLITIRAGGSFIMTSSVSGQDEPGLAQ